MPKVTKLDTSVTYREGLPPIKSNDLESHGLARSPDKLNLIHLHYHVICDHTT